MDTHRFFVSPISAMVALFCAVFLAIVGFGITSNGATDEETLVLVHVVSAIDKRFE